MLICTNNFSQEWREISTHVFIQLCFSSSFFYYIYIYIFGYNIDCKRSKSSWESCSWQRYRFNPWRFRFWFGNRGQALEKHWPVIPPINPYNWQHNLISVAMHNRTFVGPSFYKRLGHFGTNSSLSQCM